eukprot:1103752-Alexandrium_andersonii.AAC.1
MPHEQAPSTWATWANNNAAGRASTPGHEEYSQQRQGRRNRERGRATSQALRVSGASNPAGK